MLPVEKWSRQVFYFRKRRVEHLHYRCLNLHFLLLIDSLWLVSRSCQSANVTGPSVYRKCMSGSKSTLTQLQASFSEHKLSACACARICIRKYLCMHASLHVIMCICDLCVSLCASLQKVPICVFSHYRLPVFVEAVWEFYGGYFKKFACECVFPSNHASASAG